MLPVVAVDLFATLEGIFSFENQILTPAISKPKTQAPDFGRRRAKKELIQGTISDDREPFIGQNLAEAGCAVEFARNVVNAFYRVIKNVPPIDLGWSVVLKMRVAAKCF